MNPEPALLRAEEFLLISLHPRHHIIPIRKGRVGFLGQPPDVYILTRILLVLEILSNQPTLLDT